MALGTKRTPLTLVLRRNMLPMNNLFCFGALSLARGFAFFGFPVRKQTAVVAGGDCVGAHQMEGLSSDPRRWRDVDKLLSRPGNIVGQDFEPSPTVSIVIPKSASYSPS